MMNFQTRLAVLPAVALLLGATPAEQVLPFPGDDAEALIIPAGSPVRFLGWERSGKEYVGARFAGRFVLTGSFTYGCEWDCDGSSPITERENFALRVVPDHALASRLPHWKKRDNEIAIFISKATPFTHAITTPQQRAELASPSVPNMQGRIAIVVDHFDTSLDCDSANFGADFVAIAKTSVVGKIELDGDFGCG